MSYSKPCVYKAANKLQHWKKDSLTLAFFHCARRYVSATQNPVCVIYKSHRAKLMVKPVYKAFGILFIILTIFLYIHVWKDYSNNIKNIAEPMRDKVLVFKEKYGRYPTNLDESLKMLKSSGCYNNTEPRTYGENTMIYKCKSIFKDMLVNVTVVEFATHYILRFYKGYTGCEISFQESNKTKILCYQKSIIKWNA